jgi:hypothetical protein
VASVEPPDELLAVSAAQLFGVIRSDRWPMVAAYLLAAEFDGEAVVELAALSASGASGWLVDQLVPRALKEIGAPELNEEQAGQLLARLLAQVLTGSNHPVIRSLASLAPGADYPGGPVGEAHNLSEWLDCDCHEGTSEREAAHRYEAELRQLPKLHVDQRLAEAIVGA